LGVVGKYLQRGWLVNIGAMVDGMSHSRKAGCMTIERNQIYQMDCMLGMAEMPDNYVDLAIVDPPYGILNKHVSPNSFLRRAHKDINPKWDKAPQSDYFNELERISNKQIIWGMQYFAEYLPRFTQLIIWDKKNGNNYFSDGEAAFCSIPGGLRIFRHQWAGAFKDSERKQQTFPTQKPIALYKWLLSNYAKPGDLILDTHMGSGSSYIACLDMGFDYIGFEIDADYFKGIQDRVYHFTRQRSLL
jgi:site-specific DNA-methyltransferase (adenine-specific)